GKLIATASYGGAATLWQLPERAAGLQEMALRTWATLGARLDVRRGVYADSGAAWQDVRQRLLSLQTRPPRADAGLLENGARRAASLAPQRPRPVAAILWAHTQRVLGVAFSPDGRLLATTGFDGVACVWDAAGGREFRPLRVPSGVSGPAAFAPDGRT